MFFVDYLAFLLTFRGLSSPRIAFSDAARIAAGLLAIYVVTLATLWVVPTPWTLLSVAAGAAVGTMGMQGEGLARLTEAFGRLRFPAYLLAVASMAALVFLYVPIMTFLTSPGEISIHLNYLISVNARDAMLVIYVAALLYVLALTERMRTLLTLIALSVLTLGIVYSYVMPFGYPMMTGLRFEQVPISTASLVLRTAVDIVVVALVALGVCAALLRFGARPFIIGMLLINVSLGVASTVSVMRDDVGGAGGPESGTSLQQQPLRFSQDHNNVLVIFLDRFMGSYVESILQTDPQLAERMSGFTWYPRSLAPGENSIAGVHAMYGGYDYTPVEMNARKKSLRDLSVEAFSILPYNFARHGYHVNFISPRGLGFTMAGDCKFMQIDGVTCTHIPGSIVRRRAQEMGFPLMEVSKSNYAELLVLLAAMRSTPYVVKQVLHQRGPWRPFLDHSAGTTFREWAELDAFDELSFTNASDSNLNIISNILAHEPYFMGENCMPQKEQFQVPDKEGIRRGHVSLFSLQHSIAARCALLLVANYMDFLKTSGVYDNTKIVIVSDHGIVGPVEDSSSRAVAGGTQDNIFVRSRSLLLVKEVAASGTLQISDAFMPNAEMPRIVCAEIGGCVNPYLNNRPIAAYGRDDPFYVSLVPWQFSAQEPEAFVIYKQLLLKGKDPYDARNWQEQR